MSITAVVVALSFFAQDASAAKISSATDVLSRNQAGAPANHALSFVTPTGFAEGASLTVAFPAAFNASGMTEDEVDLRDDGLDLRTAPDCSGTEAASVVWSGNQLTITICPGKGGAIAAGHTAGLLIGTNAVGSGLGQRRLTNPSVSGNYIIDIAGSFGDNGQIPVAIVPSDEVAVTACVGDCVVGRGGNPPSPPIYPPGPPVISAILVDSITATTARISWHTDQSASSYVLYGISQTLADSIGNEELALDHTLVLTGLLPDQEYFYTIRSANIYGDIGWSSLLSFRTAAPTNFAVPVISNVRLLSIRSDEAEVAWDTDIPTYWQIEFGLSPYYGTAVFGSDLAATHTAKIGNLSADTIYHYRIMAIGENGLRTVTPDLAFRTYDDIPPVIYDIRIENIGLHSFDLSWKTDKLTVGSVKYGTSLSYASGEAIEAIGYELKHRVTIDGLAAGTTYHLQIYATDRGGNDGQSGDFTVRTLAISVPPNVSGLTAEAGDSQIILSWINPFSPGFSAVIINRSDDHYPQGRDDGVRIYSGAAESFTDSGLVNGKTYYYTVWSVNEIGQASSGAIIAAVPSGPPTPPINVNVNANVNVNVNVNANIPTPPPSGGVCPIHLVPLEGSKGSTAVGSSRIIVHVEEVPVAIVSDGFTAATGDSVRITVPNQLSTKPVARATLRVGDQEYALAMREDGSGREAEIIAPAPGVYLSAMLIEYGDKTSAYSRWQMKVVDVGRIYFMDFFGRKPLEGVRVMLFGPPSDIWDAAKYGQNNPFITGPDGAYSFYVPKGEYLLRIEKEGYETLNIGLGTFEGPLNDSYELKPKNRATEVIFRTIGTTNFAKLRQISYCSFPWILLIIIMLYIIYRFNKRKKEEKKKKALKK